MILEIAAATLLAYIAIGIAICSSKPWVLKRRQASFGASMTSYSVPRIVRRTKLFIFRAAMILGIVFLWPAFLFDEWRESKALSLRFKEYEKAHPYIGLTFDRIGGNRLLLCSDCDHRLTVKTGGHFVYGHSLGYQCQTCGKCDTRFYEEPFAKYHNFNRTDQIDDVPTEYRAYMIEHVRSMVSLIEGQMQKFPREKWFKNWESDLTRYREEITRVPPEELAFVNKVREVASATFEASLFCECGGPLDRDKVVFCPACRSTKLQYLAFL